MTDSLLIPCKSTRELPDTLRLCNLGKFSTPAKPLSLFPDKFKWVSPVNESSSVDAIVLAPSDFRSVSLLPARSSFWSFFRPRIGDKSFIRLFLKTRISKLLANSSPRKSLILESLTLRILSLSSKRVFVISSGETPKVLDTSSSSEGSGKYTFSDKAEVSKAKQNIDAIAGKNTFNLTFTLKN